MSNKNENKDTKWKPIEIIENDGLLSATMVNDILIDRKYIAQEIFLMEDTPEYKRVRIMNPSLRTDKSNLAIMYCNAIHWMSIFDVIWPSFEEKDFHFLEISYIVINDPDDELLPDEFYQYITNMVKMFWYFRLKSLYPNGKWKIEIFNDVERTIQATIISRGIE